MKKFLFLTFVLFLCRGVFAQEMIVQHNAKGAYIAHLVSPKENFYSLGRMYNVPPKDIAAFNGLQMEHGLNIGQTVNIPLTSQNFSQASTTGHPVYYVVGQKEGLYRVSVNNNKVLMANLRKWNNLATDVIAPGQKLVVGYLVSNDASLSTARASQSAAPEKQAVSKAPEEKMVFQNEDEKTTPK
ncbi:MAG TPA: LysM peptidoglycan-binding domain-containing protein, partial [Flavisolibacter sp.]|nr:LysM peptidoglycan-binding domain-containing protein [Flavisolibacter sp.]